ncbi:MAG TPA: hypothetical protein VHL80_11835 [Polyangia bacterium]|nr:hypothetical protein [Polyangia bacterium]
MLIPALTLLLLGLAAPGCLFTGPINSPPQVQIVLPMGPFGRGQTVKVSATAYDPDGGSIRLEWSKEDGDCPMRLDPSLRPATAFQSPPNDPTYLVPLPTGDQQTVCVWVLATDDQGATWLDAKAITSQNRPPQAVITVLEPTAMTSNGDYELYSTFHLSAASSSDPDGDVVSQPTWQLLDMPDTANPVPMLAPCPSNNTPSDWVQCLDVGGSAGKYTIGLTVFDGIDTSTRTQQVLFVDYDHPACVSKTEPALAASPIVLDPGEARTLTITEILDDGSPLPTPVDGSHTPPTFQWRVSRNGGAASTIPGYENLNALTLPADTYATGDEVVVTATISDGVTMHLEPACNPGCPAGCPQAATWTVDYR